MKNDLFHLGDTQGIIQVLNAILLGFILWNYYQDNTTVYFVLKTLGFIFVIMLLANFHGVDNANRLEKMLSEPFIQMNAVSKENLDKSYKLFKKAMGHSACCGYLACALSVMSQSFEIYEALILLLSIIFLATMAVVESIPSNVLVKDADTKVFVRNQFYSLLVGVPIFFLTFFIVL